MHRGFSITVSLLRTQEHVQQTDYVCAYMACGFSVLEPQPCPGNWAVVLSSGVQFPELRILQFDINDHTTCAYSFEERCYGYFWNAHTPTKTISVLSHAYKSTVL